MGNEGRPAESTVATTVLGRTGSCAICGECGQLFDLDAVEGVPPAPDGHAQGLCTTCTEKHKRSLQKWGASVHPRKEEAADANLESFERLLDEPEPEKDAPATLKTDAIRQAIATLQDCLPEGARCTLYATLDRDGVLTPLEDDPLFNVEITLHGGNIKP